MGFRDGVKFTQCWVNIRAHFSKKRTMMWNTICTMTDLEQTVKEVAEHAYNAGFEDGAREQSTYDPKWDAD